MKNYLEYLKHIIDEIEYLQNNSTDLEFDKFTEDETLKRAFVRSIEIIGEAVTKIPADIKEKYKEVPWSEMAGTRNRLIHAYMTIDYEIIWDILKNEISNLKNQILKIIEIES